jgi:hypothetical protein
VYVQSDIVDNIHGVLLIEISEPAARNSRSQHRNLEENPSSFASHLRWHLYIQTDENDPKACVPLGHLLRRVSFRVMFVRPTIPSARRMMVVFMAPYCAVLL